MRVEIDPNSLYQHHSEFLKQVVARTLAVISCDFVEKVMLPLMKALFQEKDCLDKISGDVDVFLRHEAQKLLSSISAKIVPGNCSNSTDYIQTDPTENTIYIQLSLLDFGDQWFRNDTNNLDKTTSEVQEAASFRSRQVLVLCIIKLIHAFADCWTRDLLKLGCHIHVEHLMSSGVNQADAERQVAEDLKTVNTCEKNYVGLYVEELLLSGEYHILMIPTLKPCDWSPTHLIVEKSMRAPGSQHTKVVTQFYLNEEQEFIANILDCAIDQVNCAQFELKDDMLTLKRAIDKITGVGQQGSHLKKQKTTVRKTSECEMEAEEELLVCPSCGTDFPVPCDRFCKQCGRIYDDVSMFGRKN